MGGPMLERGLEVIAARPFSGLLGAKVLDDTATNAVRRVAVTEKLKQQDDAVEREAAVRRVRLPASSAAKNQ